MAIFRMAPKLDTPNPKFQIANPSCNLKDLFLLRTKKYTIQFFQYWKDVLSPSIPAEMCSGYWVWFVNTVESLVVAFISNFFPFWNNLNNNLNFWKTWFSDERTFFFNCQNCRYCNNQIQHIIWHDIIQYVH